MIAARDPEAMVCGQVFKVTGEIRDLLIPCFPTEDPDRLRTIIRCAEDRRHKSWHSALAWNLLKPARGHVWLKWRRAGDSYEWGMQARHHCLRCADDGRDCRLYDGHELGHSYELEDRAAGFIAAAGAAAFLAQGPPITPVQQLMQGRADGRI
ncbi:hypothetical protein [Streptomyces tsukubensis]|uniref:hypothetical protein n=1 Tax=Streptomyces tsukubensis TaxID=83656 RepID=UPI00344E613C